MSRELLKDIAWRLNDINDMLKNGAYGLDEWSTPIVNLQSAINKVEAELAKPEPDAFGFVVTYDNGKTSASRIYSKSFADKEVALVGGTAKSIPIYTHPQPERKPPCK